MMRSLYSGVAGLKTHQTKMDVIGNNIANVNTVGFKSSSVNFADTFYQTMSAASGSNSDTGAAGVNAKQIGLGSSVAAITTNITEQGGTSATNRALDVAINGDSFLIVEQGGSTYFTKSGALNVDDSGTLYCTTNGATVMGWGVDDTGAIVRDSVKALKVMSEDNIYSEPSATGNVTMTGNIDKNDEDLETTTTPTTLEGYTMTFTFFDKIGEEYTAQMYLQNSDVSGEYNLVLKDVTDSTGESLFRYKDVNGEYQIATDTTITLGGATYTAEAIDAATFPVTGELALKADGDIAKVKFNTTTGEFDSVLNQSTVARPTTSKYLDKAIVFDVATIDANRGDDTFTHYVVNGSNETGGVELDYSNLTQYANGGISNTSYYRGDTDGHGTGNVAGEMSGLAIDNSGKIIGSYTNGETKILGQLAVTTFENPSGLEAVGDSLFAATLNSGIFDGVGQDITVSGGSFTVGALEMSNVDLANEFTNMITTQRGFQANSRIITTSDSMLEELVNLKR